ncbi:MAG: hypothetical protein OXQ29_20290 [Rhodospirillaceae bacterium]|nr:hypothetical protein [Rhodospirillaceae bacterium]
MVVGDFKDWTARFRTLDVRLLERVLAVWPRCVAGLPENPHEDTITMNLVDAITKDVRARRLFHYLEYHYEPFGYTADGVAYSKGEIDMVVLLDQEREQYLAYECKRLNVAGRGGTRSLATKYVKEGLRRFVTEKYAADLPVGCMLGYVMDGKVGAARTKVVAAIRVLKANIELAEEPTDHPPVGPMPRFSSRHHRPSTGMDIEVRHTLLPFPVTRH